MKLTKDTLINAVLHVTENGNEQPSVLRSKDMNMTLGEYLHVSWHNSLVFDTIVPNDILEMDFAVENVHYNEFGHRFTVLGYRQNNPKKVCVINKIDLAGTF
jgi:hypothetical protein